MGLAMAFELQVFGLMLVAAGFMLVAALPHTPKPWP